jgi:hypothetical protein
MKTSIRIAALSALVSLSSFSVHAQGEGDGAKGMPKPLQSTASVSDVKAGARMSVQRSEGSPGVVAVRNSGLSRETVKAEAVMAARHGSTSRGEFGSM